MCVKALCTRERSQLSSMSARLLSHC
jgi:hypothetical protein